MQTPTDKLRKPKSDSQEHGKQVREGLSHEHGKEFKVETPPAPGQQRNETGRLLDIANAKGELPKDRDCPWLYFQGKPGSLAYAVNLYLWMEDEFGFGRHCICDDSDWWYVEERAQREPLISTPAQSPAATEEKPKDVSASPSATDTMKAVSLPIALTRAEYDALDSDGKFTCPDCGSPKTHPYPGCHCPDAPISPWGRGFYTRHVNKWHHDCETVRRLSMSRDRSPTLSSENQNPPPLRAEDTKPKEDQNEKD